MNGLPVDMRGRDTGGRRHRHRRTFGTGLTNELIEHVGLASTRRTRQKDARATLQNRQCLSLPHAAPPFLFNRPSISKKRLPYAISLSTT